ncbi:hypothetical protein ElyMa_005398700 [Elysia marginata]|uniref:RING-type domain-containing protein n=1 Tax=Elysia marginata TaxID=1093978 RepID=A0AAV4EIE1_9GAST|nr:hypothetical protein ElyMa_005398700 [Elysia marginata]
MFATVDIVHLPCGHVICLACSLAMKSCPMCRKDIKERSRIQMWVKIEENNHIWWKDDYGLKLTEDIDTVDDDDIEFKTEDDADEKKEKEEKEEKEESEEKEEQEEKEEKEEEMKGEEGETQTEEKETKEEQKKRRRRKIDRQKHRTRNNRKFQRSHNIVVFINQLINQLHVTDFIAANQSPSHRLPSLASAPVKTKMFSLSRHPITLADFITETDNHTPQKHQRKKPKKRHTRTPPPCDKRDTPRVSLFDGVKRVVPVISVNKRGRYNAPSLTVPSDDYQRHMMDHGTIEERRDFLDSCVKLCEINDR